MKFVFSLVAAAVASLGLSVATPDAASAQRIVTCSSRNDDRNVCEVDTRGGVRLVRQLSSSDCVRNRTWGTSNRGIWVSRGCRAQFEVGGGWSDRRNDRYDDRYDDRRRDDRYDDRYNRGNRARISAREAAAVCRRAVAREARGIRPGEVRILAADYGRNGDYLLRWRAERGLEGICRIDDRDRDVRVSINRRRW